MKIVLVGGQCAGKTALLSAFTRELRPERDIVGDKAHDRPLRSVVTVKFAQPHYDVLAVLGKTKDRRFMQELSDAAKKAWGKDVFIEMFRHRLEGLERFGHEVFICDDARYKAELDICHKLGFTSVFVDASVEVRKMRAEAQGLEFISNHNSEVEIPELKRFCHYTLNNDGSRDELEDKAKALIAEIGARRTT